MARVPYAVSAIMALAFVVALIGHRRGIHSSVDAEEACQIGSDQKSLEGCTRRFLGLARRGSVNPSGR